MNDFGPDEIRALLVWPSGLGWGAHVYTGSSKGSLEVKSRPDDCPEWVQSGDWHRWFRRGLVVWDSNAHAIGTMLADETIELLNKLRESGDWKTDGIAIIERHETSLSLDEPARGKRGRKEKGVEPEPPPEPQRPKSKFYEKEYLHLTGRAADEFFAFLLTIENQLKDMAAEEDTPVPPIQISASLASPSACFSFNRSNFTINRALVNTL